MMEGTERERETPASVAAWANRTFGPATIERQVARAKEEWVELEEAFSVGGGYTDEYKAKEVADVIICLYRVMVDLGYPDAIDRKMAINHQRTWNVRPDGTAYHVKATTTEGS